MFNFPSYSQMDPSWKEAPLGFDRQATIGSMGCLLTDLAMVVSGFGYNETPATLNQKLQGLGANVGYLGALLVPAVLPRLFPGVVYRDYMQVLRPPAPLERINSALAAGWPVIVEVDASPAAGMQNHWLLLYGQKNGDYLLQDPFPNPPEAKPVLFKTSRYAFGGKAAAAIKAVLWLEGPRPHVNRPEGAISLYSTADGLALRSQPVIDPANLIERIALLGELYSLEPVDNTLQKVGQVNQWLNVQTPGGVQGYCAAWYLNTRREVPGPEPVKPAQPGAAMKVYTSVEQLALRSQPVVDPGTLIRRMAAGTALTVLDPPEIANPKIGVVDAWIRVADSERNAGVRGSLVCEPAAAGRFRTSHHQ